MLPSILDYYIDDDGDSNFLIKVCPNHPYPNYLCNAGVLNLPTALPTSTKNNNRHEYNKLYREMIILHKCLLMLKIDDLLKFQPMHCSDEREP